MQSHFNKFLELQNMNNPLYIEALERSTIETNAQIYNKKFANEDDYSNDRSILVYGKEINLNEINSSKTLEDQMNDSHKNLIFKMKNIQKDLEEGQYLGLIYAPYKQDHVESFIISKDHIFITAPHNLNKILEKKITESFPEIVKFNTTASFDKGYNSIQSDSVSCGAIALKTLKTLLSRKEDGKLLIETLQIKEKTIHDKSNFILNLASKLPVDPKINNTIDLPSDLLKISQSQKFVNEKMKSMTLEQTKLSVGKYAGQELSSHRLSFNRILNEDNNGNYYAEYVRKKYVEKNYNPEMQKAKNLINSSTLSY